MLARPAGQQHATGHEQEVAIGSTDVDVPRTDRLAVHRGGHRQVGDAPQNAGQSTDTVGGEMMHDEYRGWQIGGKITDQSEQGIDAPGREAHHYDIMTMHAAGTPIPASHLARLPQHSGRAGGVQKPGSHSVAAG